MPRAENNELYKKYKALAEAATSVHFVGRLATYKYYNMDQVVAQALTVFHKIAAADETASRENTDERDMPLTPVS